MVGQQGIRSGVRLVEAVARKLLHEVEHLVGLGLADAFFGGAFPEDDAVLGHFLGLLLAHGTAQQVGAAQAVATQHLRGLHDLLLVDHDAVGLGQHRLHQRVRVLHRLAAVLARHEAGDEVHGAGAVQRVERNQVFQPRGLGVAQHALHAAAFKLEHGLGLAVLEQPVGGRVIQRNVLEGKVGLPRVALHDELARQFQNGERGQAQKVELHQAYGLHVVLVVLAHRRLAAGLLVERAEVGELARRNQHATGVHAHVARHTLELLRQLDERAHVVFLLQALGQQRLHGDGVVVLVALFLGLGRVLQCDRHARLVRDELGNAVAETVGEIEHAPHIADGRARRHGAESGNLAHRVLAVFVLHVVDDAVPVGLAEIDVEVGHGHPLGVQETLEQQVVLQRVEVGDLERIGHQRTGARAAPRPYRAAVVLGPLDEVAHNEEVAREPHFQDGVELELQPLLVARALGLALGVFGVEVAQALLQPLLRHVAEVVLGGQDLPVHRWDGEVGQLRFAQHQREVAALRNGQGVGQRTGHIGKQGRHFLCGLEVLFAGEAAHAALVGQNFAFGNAHPGLVGLVVVGQQELHRVRGHHRQAQARSQGYGGLYMALVVGAAGALQLQVETVREGGGDLQGGVGGAGFVAGQQRHTDRASSGTRQHDEPFVQFLQPLPAQGGLIAHHAMRPAARQQFAQVQVALAALRQQQHTRQRLVHHGSAGRSGWAQVLQLHFGAQQGLHARATGSLVELDGAKQVVVVGQGQGGLAVGRGGGHHIVDAHGAIDHGELGMQAQMDEHRAILGRPKGHPGGVSRAVWPAPRSGIRGCTEWPPPAAWPAPWPAAK